MSEPYLSTEARDALVRIMAEFDEIRMLAELIGKADYSKVDVVALLGSLGESAHRAGDIALDIASQLELQR